jgi:succinate dehydrogenase / fumarate reductase cytochrome b subunit
MHKHRPVFFNLTQISMPIGAIASIMHRITGVLLALGLPCAIYLLDLSLQGPQGYDRVASLFDILAAKALAILFIWALTYHLLAGVRHLLSDIDVGSHLHVARRTAWLVNGIAVFVAALSIGAFF